MGESLSDHFPLSDVLYFSKVEEVKPKGRTKKSVTNSSLFKDMQFRELVSKAAKELEKKVGDKLKMTRGSSFAKEFKEQ